MAEDNPTEIIVSGSNGELMNQNPTSKPESVDVKTGGEVNSIEPNGSPGQTPVEPEPVSKPKLSAEEYLEKFRINILFEELIYRTLDNTPENPLKFLLTNLETMQKDSWEPGYSQEEKAKAVSKIFKLREPEKPEPAKGTGPRTGAGRGTAPKTGTGGTTRPIGARTGTTRPSPASKVVSSPPKTTTTTTTTNRGATTRPVTKATPTPIKTAAPRTTATTARATTAPAAGKSTTTTGGVKSGTTTTPRPATTPKTTSGATRTTTAPAKRSNTTTTTAAKTGSNTSVNRLPTKAPATPRGATKQPAATGRTVTAPKTGTGAGARGMTKQVSGKGVKTAPTGKGTKVAPGAKSDKAEPAEPEPEPQPKEDTPPLIVTPEVTVEEPREKTPEDDGVCSRIPGSDEPEVKPLDMEEQLALDDAVNHSDEELAPLTTEPPSQQDNASPVDNVAQVAEEKPLEKPQEIVMTSQQYAEDLQAIENEAEQANQGDKLEDLIDEGIVMREDYPSESYQSSRAITADEVTTDTSTNDPLLPEAKDELENVELIVEIPKEVIEEPVATSEVTSEPPPLQVSPEVQGIEQPPLIPSIDQAEVQEDTIDAPPLIEPEVVAHVETVAMLESTQHDFSKLLDLDQAVEPDVPAKQEPALLDTTTDLSSESVQEVKSDTYEPTADVSDAPPADSSPLIDPIDPPVQEVAPPIIQIEPEPAKTDPSPEPEPEPIEPIFPPATGDDN